MSKILAYLPSPDGESVAVAPSEIWQDAEGKPTIILDTGEVSSNVSYLIQNGLLSGISFTVDGPPREDSGIKKDLQHLLNRYSAESPSGTPDFILAQFLIETLKNFNEAVSRRALWRGETVLLNEKNAPGVERITI